MSIQGAGRYSGFFAPMGARGGQRGPGWRVSILGGARRSLRRVGGIVNTLEDGLSVDCTVLAMSG